MVLREVRTAKIVAALFELMMENAKSEKPLDRRDFVSPVHFPESITHTLTVGNCLDELNERQKGMPIVDCIIQEHIRSMDCPGVPTLKPIMSPGKD